MYIRMIDHELLRSWGVFRETFANARYQVTETKLPQMRNWLQK